MPRYLQHTNAFSYALRKTYPAFHDRFEQVDLADMAISVITEAELLFGLARRSHAHTLASTVHALRDKITVLPWTSECAANYARIRADLERTGQPMSVMDMMIAAHALAEDAVLVTNDSAFRRIDRLRVEDWTQSL
jgi:tRNA(fMet)-specific endonuclease VapC